MVEPSTISQIAASAAPCQQVEVASRAPGGVPY